MDTPTIPNEPGPGACCSPGGKCSGGSCTLKKVVYYLLVIGGLNWGLVGIGGFLGKNLNVVNLLLGGAPTLEYIVYILVGLAALKKVLMCGLSCKKK